MIIPARWYAGGKGLDDFRKQMLNDRHVKLLVDYPNAKDCFPNFSIGGGVCYFLRPNDYSGDCEVVSYATPSKPSYKKRPLNQFDVLIRYNDAASIVEKVRNKGLKSFSTIVSTRNPFGFPSSERGSAKTFDGSIKMFSSEGESFVNKDSVTSGFNYLNKFKIMQCRFTAEHANEPGADGKYKILSTIQGLYPNEVCTDSYIVSGPFDTKEEMENCICYLKTKFVRFLVMLSISSINVIRDSFSFVPLMTFDKRWNDETLFQYYSLSNEEISFITSLIREY